MSMKHDLVVVGGFGHVGLPLAILLADRGKQVCALDIDEGKRELIARGRLPFMEQGAGEILKRVLQSGRLTLSLDPADISATGIVLIIIGTPVDRHLNPEFEPMQKILNSYLDYFRDGQLVILRSTVYPGTTEMLQRWFREHGKNVELAFCPERIAEGQAIRELETLPQIISSFSEDGLQRCRDLFGLLTEETLVLSPIEAELAKLFNNVWRYITFAAANQFFMIANDHGADFYRIHQAMTHKYERARGLPGPGFAAGPCLFKDAMQLAAFNNDTFYLGHAAMLANEGLPNYIVSILKKKHDLSMLTAGILGMSFKAGIDDPRESLSYKLKKILGFECRRVLCTDAYIKSDEFIDPEQLLEQADIVVLAAPHQEYAGLRPSAGKIVVDIWNMWGNGCLL